MKTVLMVVATRSRINFMLRSSVFRVLRERGVQIVVVSPFGHEAQFQAEFGGENVRFETLPTPSKFAVRIASLRNMALRLIHPKLGEATRIHRYITRRYRIREEEVSLVTKFVLGILPSPIRRSERFWNFLETSLAARSHGKLFREYHPDAVILASAGAEGADIPFVMLGHRAGISVFAIDGNIDVFTFRYFSKVRPGVTFMLFNEEQRTEAMTLQGIPGDRLVVTGAARYDFYLREFSPEPRDVFLKKLGLDPRKKVVTFGAKLPTMYPESGDIMEILAGAIVSGDLGVPAELYVRFDPGHDPARYESLFRRYPFVRYERAEQASSREHIGNLFASSDVVVSIGSTFNVEAALFDTPSLFIGYDGFRKPERIEDSYALVYELDLFKRLTGGGGIRLVRTREETVDCIRGYLADRSKDREGRRLLVRSVTNPDGMAGERIASEVLRTLGL